MKRVLGLSWLIAIIMLQLPRAAQAQRAQFEELVATHAKANAVPELLVHRVILRESRYRADLVGRGGTIGLMQIKLATARSLGYQGDATGLREPNTNLTYGVKYLAGAWRTANGDRIKALRYYSSGYYQAAKRQRLAQRPDPMLASAPAKPAEADETQAPVEQAPQAIDASDSMPRR
jgi:soluble lytic murein transglycosylase-like protein